MLNKKSKSNEDLNHEDEIAKMEEADNRNRIRGLVEAAKGLNGQIQIDSKC